MTLDCICQGSEPTVSKREEKAEPTVKKREEMPTVRKREEMPTVSKREEMVLSASNELGDCAVTFVESAEFHGE